MICICKDGNMCVTQDENIGFMGIMGIYGSIYRLIFLYKYLII